MVAAAILLGVLLTVESTRRFVLGTVSLAGPAAAYGGLVGLVLGRLGVRSAQYVVLALCCGALALVAIPTAVVLESASLRFIGVGSSGFAIVFAVAGYSRSSSTSERFVPPTDRE
ncbi:hypothetical protein EA472_05945 [Natrarchaeobius oligotrophus]|uniref:Uncharacterized protein n=1 Tax=Natrarchaeobius chitinivorans TaxID=1679083 RepID=A0A3N6MV78_NATCH|nr:hypothetical protein EA472_05945 [Natrarchaeobius chitinivorans]